MKTARRRRADYLNNREQLLEAAREIAAERGPEALSVSEAARRAGLNRTTAYAHFAKRADLLAAVKDSYQRRTIEMLSERMPLEDWVDHVVHGTAGSGRVYRLLIHELLEGNPNREGWDAYTTWMQEIAKERGHPDGPAPDFMANFLAAMLMMWPLIADMQYDEEALPEARQQLAEQIMRLLRHGFFDTRSGTGEGR